MARLTQADFVRAWTRAKSVDEVQELTGLNRMYCHIRASELRRLGVPLKKFKGIRRPKVSK